MTRDGLIKSKKIICIVEPKFSENLVFNFTVLSQRKVIFWVLKLRYIYTCFQVEHEFNICKQKDTSTAAIFSSTILLNILGFIIIKTYLYIFHSTFSVELYVSKYLSLLLIFIYPYIFKTLILNIFYSSSLNGAIDSEMKVCVVDIVILVKQ